MENKFPINKQYVWVILLLMFFLPVLSIVIEYETDPSLSIILLTGKWFVFWAIGIRLLTAGLKQVINPAFTAQSIFHLKEKESFVIVKELGFANICIGLLGIISLFIPGYRSAVAFSGGLFFAIAGINHIIKKSTGPNETLAMFSDLFIALVMLAFLVMS